MSGAICPQPGRDECLDQTPCSDCVSLGRPLPLTVGDEPQGFDDTEQLGGPYASGTEHDSSHKVITSAGPDFTYIQFCTVCDWRRP